MGLIILTQSLNVINGAYNIVHAIISLCDRTHVRGTFWDTGMQ